MKTGLRQRQVQLQKLSPQQIQLMKLLQVPTVLLEQRIKEELEINPVLEEGIPGEGEGDDFSQDGQDLGSEIGDTGSDAEESREIEDYVNEYLDGDDDGDSYKTRSEQGFGEEEERQLPMAVENSFHEYLEQQLGLMEFESAQELEIARQIIGSIDDDGYLRRDPISVADDLLFTKNIDVGEPVILKVLKKVQRMEPPGIGARDLQECLAIQLDQLLEVADTSDDDTINLLKVARKIIVRYFEAFSKKHYEKLQRSLGVDERYLKAAIGLILKLNPKPASAYSGDQSSMFSQYIIPDFVVYNRGGELELSLNARNAPDLRVSEYFKDMLRNYAERKRKRLLTRQEKEAAQFIKQKIESARWFMDAIRQRHETMFKAMYAILQLQKEYFLSGDEKKIRPMILQDISDLTGLDVSTVSRVANSKFVQTEYGTRRLKDFFSEGMQNSEGEEVSTLEVKQILTELIGNEQKRNPLSDDRLTQLLQEKGYNIARRTVAKYRDQLNIPKASLRKVI